ncbi:MAG: prolipoprotein diacylglyceryl transferase, partial [Clostridia bacterium]|nr:prolipoprotein diacylglyceryl transferase [Clostridia bacterium]
IVLGIICAFTYATMRAKHYSISFDDMLDITIYTVISGIIGARLYYVLSKLDSYTSFWDVFKIWEGGLGIYGGIICGGIALFTVARIKKLNFAALFDCTGPGVMLAQAIGRWGNFFNGEAFGKAPAEGTLLYTFRMTVKQEYWSTSVLCQPCFLYESLWNLLGFALINIFYKKKKFNGQVFFEYIIWYGLGRFFIESQRTDSLYLGNTGIRLSMLVASICVIVGLGFVIYGISASHKTEICSGGYADVFGRTLAGAQSVPADGADTVPGNNGSENNESSEDDGGPGTKE